MKALINYGQYFAGFNNVRKALPLLLASVLTPPAFANYSDFEALLPQGSEMGFILTKTDGSVIASHNSDKLMPPASTLKLMLASAAWFELGPEFRFDTRVYTGEVRNGVADGDLVFQMSGDPTFTRADLYRLLQRVKKAGIHTIKGRLVFDDQLFYGYDRARGWPWDDLGVCFSAPVSTTMLDGNCVKIRLEPKAGSMIVNKPSHIPLNVVSHVRKEPMNMMCPLELEMDGLDYAIHGCADKPLPLSLAVSTPKRYTAAVVKQQLAELGIRLLEQDDQWMQITSQVAAHQSIPLPRLLQRVLQKSDNLVSDSLLRHLGVKRFQVGSFPAGVAAMNDILAEEMLLEFGHSDLFDGSGLSRYNLTTAASLAQVLQQWQTNPRFQPLVELLPVAGENGTLLYRQGTIGLKGNLAAKTGSFNQVANLAGFLTTKSGEQLIFVQMINGINGQLPNTKAQLVEFEQALYNCIQYQCFAEQTKQTPKATENTGVDHEKQEPSEAPVSEQRPPESNATTDAAPNPS